MNCLCGHFESCEHCRPKEWSRRPTAAEWGVSITVELPPDPLEAKLAELAKKWKRA